MLRAKTVSPVMATLTQTATGTQIIGPGLNPTITGVQAGQATTDTVGITPFAGVKIGDPTAGLTETVTISPSTIGNGTWNNLGSGSVATASIS